MKYLFIVSTVFCLLLSLQSNAQADRLTSFLTAVADSGVSDEVIINTYLCKTTRDTQQLQLIHEELGWVRKDLKASKTRTIVRYLDLPEEQRYMLTDEANKKFIYVVQLSDGKWLPFLLKEDGLLYAIAALDKGGPRFFLGLCK